MRIKWVTWTFIVKILNWPLFQVSQDSRQSWLSPRLWPRLRWHFATRSPSSSDKRAQRLLQCQPVTGTRWRPFPECIVVYRHLLMVIFDQVLVVKERAHLIIWCCISKTFSILDFNVNQHHSWGTRTVGMLFTGAGIFVLAASYSADTADTSSHYNTRWRPGSGRIIHLPRDHSTHWKSVLFRLIIYLMSGTQ